MRAVLSLVVLLGLSVPPSTSAEDRFPPEAGTRVRISAPRYYLFQETAVVDASNRFDFTAVLEDDGTSVRMPYADLARMDASRGETRLTLFGAVGGAILGGTLGAATTPMPRFDSEDPFHPPSGGDSFGRFMVGAMVGGAIGAILGSTLKMETWEPVFTARRRFR